ncbi:MAG: FAD binding domain-containing protein [Anaerolineae bacterium]|nr:FAD binding domain-containing protein [Anaerolineae bacterium]
MWREYLFPQSVAEALEMLRAHNGSARIIAGGTDLVLQRKEGKSTAVVAVDISRIPGLNGIEVTGDHVRVGALVTHAQVAAAPLILERAAVLAEACSKVGGPQTRNVGTLVGNVVNALPAADSAIALMALDAEVEVVALEGKRWLPLKELYRGVGQCCVDACSQIVTTLRFRSLESSYGSAYERLAKRRSLILPILAVAAVVGVDNGRFKEVRIAMGPVALVPLRVSAAEDSLRGRPIGQEAIKQAAAKALAAAQPRDSVLRGSREYRQAMVEVLARRALTRATVAAGYSLE